MPDFDTSETINYALQRHPRASPEELNEHHAKPASKFHQQSKSLNIQPL
jgi:hypothetical protein